MKTGKITKILNKNSPSQVKKNRNYIGASSIGNKCARAIWYELEDFPAPPFSKTQERTFEIGNTLEKMLIEIMENSGLTIIKPKEENNYLEFFDPQFPYLRGHADGIIKDYDAVLEIKTASNSSFNEFVKKGVKSWRPQYYSQMQCYMGMSEIRKAYILVLNKDTSEVCDEEIDYDPTHYEHLVNLAEHIYETAEPGSLPRISNLSGWYECKQCRFREPCHFG